MFSKKLGSADYLISEAGPDHDKQFTAKVIVNGQEFGTGTGKSKKTAEQNAAKEAFEKLSKN
jgi:ribonuclease-3